MTSALVVGIERYGFGESGPRIPGAAKSAAEFARWLLDRQICQPGRITLMAAYEEEEDPLEPTGTLIEGLREDGVRVLNTARADQDLAVWIQHGPRQDDELFVLFWVGHGFAHPRDPYEEVCLLGEDADDFVLRHVELRQLMTAAGTAAPRARQVAFVDACRGVIPYGWESRLTGGNRPVPLGNWEPSNREKSIVYAAAHGKTTKQAGWTERTFADVLLEKLDRLPRGKGPGDLFETGLEQLMDELAEQQGAPFWTIYRYEHGGTKKPYLAPDDGDLTKPEWADLEAEANAIDGAASRTARFQELLWHAYCVAVGPALPSEPHKLPARLENVSDLVRVLRDEPARRDALPPPLVTACDFVVTLSRHGTMRGLAAWCTAWANAHAEGHGRLKRARHRYPSRLEENYLSIMIAKPEPEPEPHRRDPARTAASQHRLTAVLWAAGNPKRLEPAQQSTASKNKILPAVHDLINQVDHTYKVIDIRDMVVEFVLPETLLGWPTLPEQQNLGLNHPVVVRDLERLTGQVPGITLAENKWRHIERYAQGRKLSWGDRIKWFDIGPSPSVEEIEGAVALDDTFCIALAPWHAMTAANGRRNGIPAMPMLIETSQAGAAIVVWIYHDHQNCSRHYGRNGDHRMWRHGRNGSSSCAIPHIRNQITRGVSKKKSGGLLELPRLLKKIRQEMSNGNLPSAQIGVLMENTSRFPPNYFGWGVGVAPAGGGR